jgi:hypothetical protein
VYPATGEVLHFSEDPSIEVFEPHVAATARQPEAYVWAVDAARSPDYWFPRLCPRVLAWVTPTTTPGDARLLGLARRVHLVQHDWLDAMRTAQLYAYRLPADTFVPFGEFANAQVSTVPVRPLGRPDRVGDLFELHDTAGIELRAASNLWPYSEAWYPTSLGFSAIRMRNARPRSPSA